MINYFEGFLMRLILAIALAAVVASSFAPIAAALCDWSGTYKLSQYYYITDSTTNGVKEVNGPIFTLTLEEVSHPKITGNFNGVSIDGQHYGNIDDQGIQATFKGATPWTQRYPTNGGYIELKFEDAKECGSDVQGKWMPSVSNGWGDPIYLKGNRIQAGAKIHSGSSVNLVCEKDASCMDPARHLIGDKNDIYPDCTCVCEPGWHFNDIGDCVPDNKPSTTPESTSVPASLGAKVQITSPQGGVTKIMPGESAKVELASGESVSIEVACNEARKYLAIFWLLYDTNEESETAPKDVKCKFGYVKAFFDKWCDFSKPPFDSDIGTTVAPIISSNVIEIELEEGPLRTEVIDDQVSLDIQTPNVIVSSVGKNTFGVAYDPKSGKSSVAAYQYPIQVKPIDGSQAPFTLESGQKIEVSNGQVTPVTPSGQTSGTETGQNQSSVPEGQTRQTATDYLNEGQRLADQGKYEDALQAYEKGLALSPQWTDLYYHEGTAYAKLGRIDDAVQAFQKVIQINPKDGVLAYYWMGRVLSGASRYEEAINAYKKSIESFNTYGEWYPGHKSYCALSWYHMGLALDALGRSGEAQEAYRNANNLDPSIQIPVAGSTDGTRGSAGGTESIQGPSDGTGGAETVPFKWIGMDAGRGHFLLNLNLPDPKAIQQMSLYYADASGNRGTDATRTDGQLYDTTGSVFPKIAVFYQGVQQDNGYLNRNIYSGNLDLYAADKGWFRDGSWWAVEVTYVDGTKRTEKTLIGAGGIAGPTESAGSLTEGTGSITGPTDGTGGPTDGTENIPGPADSTGSMPGPTDGIGSLTPIPAAGPTGGTESIPGPTDGTGGAETVPFIVKNLTN
jgi:tetratricopeptide (TPR) repeat protein